MAVGKRTVDMVSGSATVSSWRQQRPCVRCVLEWLAVVWLADAVACVALMGVKRLLDSAGCLIPFSAPALAACCCCRCAACASLTAPHSSATADAALTAVGAGACARTGAALMALEPLASATAHWSSGRCFSSSAACCLFLLRLRCSSVDGAGGCFGCTAAASCHTASNSSTSAVEPPRSSDKGDRGAGIAAVTAAEHSGGGERRCKGSDDGASRVQWQRHGRVELSPL